MSLPARTITWTLDSVTFDQGQDPNGFSYTVKKSTGWMGSPPPRPDLQNKPAGNGAYSGPNYDAPRVITLDGIAQCVNRADQDLLYDTLAGLCRDPETIYTLTKQEYTRALSCGVIRSAATDIQTLPDGTLTFSIVLSAPDARKYDTNLQQATTGLASGNMGGVLWNGTPGNTGVEWNGAGGGTGVQWQQTAGSSGFFSMANAGSAPTPVFFTITAPPSGPLVQPTISTFDGQVLTYGGTMAANDVLTIDTGTGLALLNGANVGALFTQFNLFEIPARSTLNAQFSANNAGNGSTLLAQWSNAY